MKKLLLPAAGVGLMGSIAGCAQIHSALGSVEAFVKAPPQIVVDALHVISDLLMGVLGVFLHGVLAGLPGALGL